MKILTYTFFLILLIGSSCTTDPKPYSEVKEVSNIILLIGDGMGIGQITAGMYASPDSLNILGMPVIGLHANHSYDDLITDSAAAATALSTGKKTYNGAIGVDADTIPQKTILEMAEEQGLATGLIATSTITHATPAAFISHQPSRNMYEEIAADFLKTEIDFFIGGGILHFRDRQDNRDLYLEFEEKGYAITDSIQIPFESLEKPDVTRNFAYLTAKGSPNKFIEGRAYFEKATRMAIEFLDQHSEKGFFLMVESSQIDWGGHDNATDYVVQEMLEFDRVIGNVLDFARKDGQTLVVVTGDHETGGMALDYGTNRDTLVAGFTGGGHTADLIPVFAFGPKSETFSGVYDNTAVFKKMVDAFGWHKP